MGKIKKYTDFVNENNTEIAPVRTTPGIKPGERKKPSPIKKPGIGVKPAPAKAETEEVIALFNKLASELDKKEVDGNYEKH